MRPSRTPPGIVFAVGFGCGALALATLRLVWVDRGIELVRSVRDLAQASYVERPDGRELVDDALRGMLSGLDRYSRYYGPEEIEAVDRETQGEYRGIGVLFLDADRGVVRFALPGSPAEAAGLRPGDRLVRVDEAWVADLPPGTLRDRLRGTGSLALDLLVEGRDGARRRVALVPSAVVDPSARHVRMLDRERGIGYLSLSSFSHHTPEEVDRWTGWLEGEGMRALVLDLRANPGGILDAALSVADRFIPQGVLVSTKGRTQTLSWSASASHTSLEGLPLVVLVDGDSASASEVLSGALQDHRAAVVVGEPTYGKGAVQTLTHFDRDRALVKITTSRYFTPAGRRIERGSGWDGLAPDLLVEVSAAERRAVHAFLASYSPPPGALADLAAWEAEEGLEVLPRPPADRQLAAAVALLSGEPPAIGPGDGG